MKAEEKQVGGGYCTIWVGKFRLIQHSGWGYVGEGEGEKDSLYNYGTRQKECNNLSNLCAAF